MPQILDTYHVHEPFILDSLLFSGGVLWSVMSIEGSSRERKYWAVWEQEGNASIVLWGHDYDIQLELRQCLLPISRKEKDYAFHVGQLLSWTYKKQSPTNPNSVCRPC